jgi:hypothetical protein
MVVRVWMRCKLELKGEVKDMSGLNTRYNMEFENHCD